MKAIESAKEPPAHSSYSSISTNILTVMAEKPQFSTRAFLVNSCTNLRQSQIIDQWHVNKHNTPTDDKLAKTMNGNRVRKFSRPDIMTADDEDKNEYIRWQHSPIRRLLIMMNVRLGINQHIVFICALSLIRPPRHVPHIRLRTVGQGRKLRENLFYAMTHQACGVTRSHTMTSRRDARLNVSRRLVSPLCCCCCCCRPWLSNGDWRGR